MGRVDEFVRHGKHHGILCCTGKVATPPRGLVIVLFHTLHEDEQVWVSSQNGIGATLGRLIPIGGGGTIAPGCGLLGFVEQIGTNHRGIARVALRQHHPVIDPLSLGVVAVARDIPHILVRIVISLRGMTIEEDLQTDLTSVSYHLVHALDGGESLEVGIHIVIDTASGGTACEHLVAKGNPERVEPK